MGQMIKGVWVGLTVEWPAVEDAHVTLAYFPMFDLDAEGDLTRLTEALYTALDWWFPLNTVEHAAFEGRPGETANVVKVEMPVVPGRLVAYYRDSLIARGMKYSKTFAFDPHVTVNVVPVGTPYHAPVTPPFLRVTSLFIDWGKEHPLDPGRSHWEFARLIGTP